MRQFLLAAFLFVFSGSSFPPAAFGAAKPTGRCRSNDLTKRLCATLERAEKCDSESSKCDGNEYLAENMGSYMNYLGELLGLAKGVQAMGLYSGEIQSKVHSFASSRLSGNRFWGRSADRNFIYFINHLNEKSRIIAKELNSLR